MTTFNSIWTTSLNQALQLQKKNSSLSIGGLNSASGSSGTLLGQINAAKGLQGPLDMLLSVVSKSVSDVMASYSPTQGMNFSNSFKSAFSLSPFQQTSMTMNNSIAANSISNLSKGIFSQATSAKSMTTQEKSNLMTTLLSGVNLGFLNSKSLLDSQGLLTEMIHESLNNLQNNVQSNIGGYYGSVIRKSLNVYENLTETGITTSVTPPPATTTPEITTIVTPPESATTTPEIAPPAVTTETTTVPPTEILADVNIQDYMDKLKNMDHVEGSFTGTYLTIDDKMFVNDIVFDNSGNAHVRTTSGDYYSGDSFDEKSVSAFIDYNETSAQDAFTSYNGYGNINIDLGGGVMVSGEYFSMGNFKFTDDQLKAITDNATDVKTRVVDGTTYKEYYGDVVTDAGNVRFKVATEIDDGTTKGIQTVDYMSGSFQTTSYIETKTGGMDSIKQIYYYGKGAGIPSGVETFTEINGVEKTADELIAYAKDKGLYSQTVIADDGTEITEYWLREPDAERDFMARDFLVADVGGNALKTGEYAFSDYKDYESISQFGDSSIGYYTYSGDIYMPPVIPPDTTTPPSPIPLEGVLLEPAVQELLKNVDNQVLQFSSGTFMPAFTGNNGFSSIFTDVHTDSQGVGHKIVGIADIENIYSSNSKYNEYFVVDGEKAFETLRDAENYIDSSGVFSIKDGAGNSHTLEGVFNNGQFQNVELDGTAMTSDELVKWAEDNGLKKGTSPYGYDNSVSYYADVQTPYGTQQKLIAGVSYDGTTKNMFEDEGYWNYPMTHSDVFIKAGDGSVHSFKPNDGNFTESLSKVDGNELSQDELVQWAEDNGLEKVTLNEGGNIIQLYYADIVGAKGDMKAEIVSSVNGVANTWTNPSFSAVKTISASGETHFVNRTWGSTGSYASWFSIDGMAVSNAEAADMVKSATNLQKSSFEFDGVQYDVYSQSGNQNELTIDTSTGEIANVFVSEQKWIVDGASITQSTLTNSIDTKDVFKVGGNEMNINEFKDWAVANNVKTAQWTATDGTVYTEYIGKPSYATWGTIIIAEGNGKVYNRQEYNSIKNPYGSPVTLDMNGDGIQTVSAENGVEFDLLGTGQAVKTGWTAGGDDALLALDRNNSGAIESGKELFGNQHGAANGYEELAKFDDNNDGVIDNRDKVYSNLKLWNDVNMNGMSEAGELRGLAESGVASISTGFKTSSLVDAAGNEHRQVSSFTKTNGQKGVTTDLWFRYYGITSYINNQYLPSR